MSDWTYQFTDEKANYETYEWDNFWIDHANDKTTPRIFYIGDSISGGIRPQLASLIGNDFRIDALATSMALDNPFWFEFISLCRKQLMQISPARDYILFNNGLHGWHLSDDEYMQHYEKCIDYFRTNFSKSKIELVLSTSVKDPDREKRVISRNDCTRKLAEKFNLKTIDLYSESKAHFDLIRNDGVHYTEPGYILFAKKIMESINK